MQAPLQKYYASLAERAKQQRAMRNASEVNVGSRSQQAASDASEDEDLAAPLPTLQQPLAAPAPQLPAGGLDFKAQMAAGKAARKKAAAAAAAPDAAPSDTQVCQYRLSCTEGMVNAYCDICLAVKAFASMWYMPPSEFA